MTKKTYLLLDDVRRPFDVFLYTFKLKYLFRKWVIVRNYKELKEWVFKNGLPYFISFDHDLHPSHYTPKEYWSDYEVSKKWQEAQTKIECNGEDCASMIRRYYRVRYWETKPKFYVHSKNPVGRDKILKILNSF